MSAVLVKGAGSAADNSNSAMSGRGGAGKGPAEERRPGATEEHNGRVPQGGKNPGDRTPGAGTERDH